MHKELETWRRENKEHAVALKREERYFFSIDRQLYVSGEDFNSRKSQKLVPNLRA